jgi:hypothetical protein
MVILDSHGTEFINEDDKATKLLEIIYYYNKTEISQNKCYLFYIKISSNLHACISQTVATYSSCEK